jgi:hypothetical protein
LPTIPAEELDEYILNLYKEETCRLPCWWGITPGETNWQEAERFLDRFSNAHAKQSPLKENTKVGFAQIKVPDYVKYSRLLEYVYIIEDGVIERVEVPLVGELYNLSSFLEEYGEPGEIWISTYRTEYPAGVLPFIIYLFYPDQGILANFGPQDAFLTSNSVKGCKLDNPPFNLKLWSAEDPALSFQEIGKLFEMHLDRETYLPIEEATGMSVAEFYELFKKPGNPTCLVTPKELWDEQQ